MLDDVRPAHDVNRVREAAALRLPDQVEEIVRLAEIPAPPFGEEKRARYVLSRLAEIGLDRPRLDATGNVLATLDGPAPGPRLLVAAHVDTVFPEGTDVTVTREDGVLRGPGIGDNAANLGAMLAVAEILLGNGGIQKGEIHFAGTVGEEGLGDLRGMRGLMRDLHDRIDAVICLDGTLGKVVVRGVGSRRYRIRCHGPGGHSFGDFGRPSAVHAMARLVTRITEIVVPEVPKTTFNVGGLRGGDGITNVAREAEMLLDLRSEGRDELDRLDGQVGRLVAAAERESEIAYDVETIGERPAGATPEDSQLVRTIVKVHRGLGVDPDLEASSTDANIPMSLGIPAVTFGTYVGRGCHTLLEEVRISGLETGLALAALVLRELTA